MAINKNHECEELDGSKCAIVEKMATRERCLFLKNLLELNGFTVKVVPSPPAKTAAAADPPDTDTPDLFTIGVTDLTFNSINAVFGRLLKTGKGHTVTLAYWNQQVSAINDEIPYYAFKG